jgi:ATP-dependent protease ClpP protease subunit
MRTDWTSVLRNSALERSSKFYRIDNRTSGRTVISIFGEIGSWDVNSSDFDRVLKDIDTPEIELRINSNGGSAFDGIAMYNGLKNHPAHVEGYVDGIAASAASVIAMACDKLTMEQGSRLMIHDALAGIVGSFNEADLEEMYNELKPMLSSVSDDLAEIYKVRAGGTRKEWRDRMRATTWYNAKEAVDARLADEVARPKKSTRAEAEVEVVAQVVQEVDVAEQRRLEFMTRWKGQG